MYDKNDAYQALNLLKSRYRHVSEKIESVKKEIQDGEKSKQDWEYIKKRKKTSGYLWTGFFALNMVWGFASLVVMGIFAGLALFKLATTVLTESKMSRIIGDHDAFLKSRNVQLNSLEQNKRIITKNLDLLQDVVHLKKPIEERHERIMKGMNMLPKNMLNNEQPKFEQPKMENECMER